jgi:hypothetical protein
MHGLRETILTIERSIFMTKTYMIHAWCIRPFITSLDPVAADTPEQAIAIGRTRQEELLDAAEECTKDYPWDEFAAYGDDGTELLHILDDKASLVNAAPDMLEALEAQEMAEWDPEAARRKGYFDRARELRRAAIARAKGGAQ